MNDLNKAELEGIEIKLMSLIRSADDGLLKEIKETLDKLGGTVKKRLNTMR